jgi:two-component system sensor histidine kinase/response regulator
MTDRPHLTPEVLVPRLGDYLVEKGLITPQALQKTLNRQRELKKKQQFILLGQLLVEMGAIDRQMLEEAITEQIIQLRSALQEANHTLELRVQQRTAELEQALQKLSELNQLKSNFVANISHELRTPLTHVKGYVDLMIAGDLGPISNDQRQALIVMQHSADRLHKLIEDMILFSMSDSGQMTLNIKSFDLHALCQEAINRSLSKATEFKISLINEIPQNLAPTIADQEKILWVILQLLDNALKFTPPGGSVKLRVQSEGNFAKIGVMDTGIGIPKDRMNEIFEPFHQLDSSSTRKYGGTGLGLALVRDIINAHGSVIRVTSTESKGSHFEFLLKLASSIAK